MSRELTFKCSECGITDQQGERGRPRSKCLECRRKVSLAYQQSYYQNVLAPKRKAAKEQPVQV